MGGVGSGGQNRRYRVGEERIMKNGSTAKIVVYKGCMDLNIEFDNGLIVKNTTYGEFKKGTIRFPMSYVKCDGMAKVSNCNTGFEFIVDEEDAEKIIKKGYWYSSHGYAYSNKYGFLHRLLTRAKKGECVDHINMNKTDNRKRNIRICTRTDNNRNRSKIVRLGKVPQSKFKGVKPVGNRWAARIRADNTEHHIGIFETEESAARAYNKEATRLFGEFARCNIIKGVENESN
jgi:hypothetical protein